MAARALRARIAAVREKEELALAASTSQKRVWQIETSATRVSYEALCALADALGVPLEMLTIRARVIESDRTKAGRAPKPD